MGKEEVQKDGAFTFYTFSSRNGKEAWIYKIKIQNGKKHSSLSIPKTIHGKKVTRLGWPDAKGFEPNRTLFDETIEPEHDVDGSTKAVNKIRSIRLPDTVEVIEPCAFSGLDSVKKIQIPAKVKKLEKYTFYGCDSLKTVVLPDSLKKLDNTALRDCPSLKSLQLSAKNKTYRIRNKCLIRKKDQVLVYVIPTGKDLQIPDGVRVISAYAFINATSPTVHIPASVQKIERAAFQKTFSQENINIKNVTVSEANSVYAKDGQCIYNKADKSLAVAIPDADRVLYISNMVEKLTPEYSLVNCDTSETDLDKVIYPESLKYVIVPGFMGGIAHNVYFTGNVPPEVERPKGSGAALPIFCNVYVPKDYADTYQAWYKQHKCASYVNSWNLYDPATIKK